MTNIDKIIEELDVFEASIIVDGAHEDVPCVTLDEVKQALLDIQKETAKQNYAEGYKQGRFDEKMDNLNITGEDYE